MSRKKAKHGIDNKKTHIEETKEKVNNMKRGNDADNSNEKKKKTKKPHKILRAFLAILLTIMVILGVIFGTYVYKAGGSLSSAVMNIFKDVMGDQDPVFVLVMGVSEDISVELTDTIILVGYNPDTNKAFMLSIPRDTFVGRSEAYAGGYDKINSLYQTSPEKTVEAVENLTGVQIDYYVTVKTSALVDIVNAIGGVEYDVPINMDYDDDSQDLHIHLKAGQQMLNGDQAEQLVRFRHNNNGTSYSTEYGDNDIGRMRTQREFLKVVANKLISTNSVDKLKDITKIIFKNLSTNAELSKALTYVPYVASFDPENDLTMEQLPGNPRMLNELWFYKADTTETQKLMTSYADKLGLSNEEKAKYFKPIKYTAGGGGTSGKQNNNKNVTPTPANKTNITTTNTVTNTTTNKIDNSVVVTNQPQNNIVNNTTSGNTVGGNTNTVENPDNGNGQSENQGGASKGQENGGGASTQSPSTEPSTPQTPATQEPSNPPEPTTPSTSTTQSTGATTQSTTSQGATE